MFTIEAGQKQASGAVVGTAEAVHNLVKTSSIRPSGQSVPLRVKHNKSSPSPSVP